MHSTETDYWNGIVARNILITFSVEIPVISKFITQRSFDVALAEMIGQI